MLTCVWILTCLDEKNYSCYHIAINLKETFTKEK